MFRSDSGMDDRDVAIVDLARNQFAVASRQNETPNQIRTFRRQSERDSDHCALTMRTWRIVFSPEAGGGGGSLPPSFVSAARNSSKRALGTSAKIKMPCSSAN